jgi:hypothetical protein
MQPEPWEPYHPIEPWVVFPVSNVEKAAAPYFKSRPTGLNLGEIQDLFYQADVPIEKSRSRESGYMRWKSSRRLRYVLRDHLAGCIQSMTPRPGSHEYPAESVPIPRALIGTHYHPDGIGAGYNALREMDRELSSAGSAVLTRQP